MIRTVWVVVLLALFCGVRSADAWRPDEWHYAVWPYYYSLQEGYWLTVGPGQEHWCWRFAAGGIEPVRFDQCALVAQGWNWFDWPYAYSLADGHWYYCDPDNAAYTFDPAIEAWSRMGVCKAYGADVPEVSQTWSTRNPCVDVNPVTGVVGCDARLDGEGKNYLYERHALHESRTVDYPDDQAVFAGYDSSGRPWCSYVAPGNELVFAARQPNGAWVEPVPRTWVPSGVSVNGPRLGMDDKPYYIGVEGWSPIPGQPAALWYFCWDGSVWQVRGIWSSQNVYRYDMLSTVRHVRGADGVLHIAFEVYLKAIDGLMDSYDLRYLRDNGTQPMEEVIAYFGDHNFGSAGADCEIMLDRQGRPVVVSSWKDYNDTGGSTLLSYLQVSRRTAANTWQNEFVCRSNAGYSASDGERMTGCQPAVWVDDANAVHVVFSDMAAWHDPYQNRRLGQVRYAVNRGAGWQLSTLLSQSFRYPSQGVTPQAAPLAVAVSEPQQAVYVWVESELTPDPLYQNDATHELRVPFAQLP